MKLFKYLWIWGAIMPACLLAQDLGKIGSAKPVTLSGGLGARTIFYNNEGFAARRQPFSYILTGNVGLKIYDLTIPFSFTYSNQDFFLSQPFNQFGASPTYKWMTLHLGYRNLSFSQYTLAGHQMLGVGGELNPGKFRISFMQGRLQKAVSEDTTLLSLRRPAYERKGWGLKLGYGSTSDFIDLIIFKAEDDETSLENGVTSTSITPGENLVVGVNLRKSLFKKLSFYFDGALSAYVLDRTLEGSEVSDLPALLDPISGLITLNESTQFYSALKTGLTFNTKNFGLQSYYQRIEPDYRSMGLYFINNDVLAYNVAPSFTLLKGKLRLNGALTFQEDNLTNKKAVTTKRVIPQVSVGLSTGIRWNFGFTYTNMSSLMEEGALPLDNALKMDQNNPIYSANVSYMVADTIRSHVITVFANRSRLVDNNLLTQEFSEYVGSTLNVTYSFNHAKRLWGTYVSFNSNNLETFTGKLPGTGFSLGFNKSLVDNKLTFNANMSIASQDETDSQSFAFGASYQVNKHQLSANLNFLNTQLNEDKFKEFTGYLNYSIRF